MVSLQNPPGQFSSRSAGCLLVRVTLFALSLSAVAHEESSRASYLGNEGVLVTHEDTAVLFDAFYTESYGQYLLVDKKVGAAVLDGEAPYDNIKAIFVSHVHGDHFSPEPTRNYLAKHPHVKLFASGQVIDVLTAGRGDEFDRQLFRFDLKPGETAEGAELPGISTAVVSIPHAGGERHSHIENLAFRVSLDDGATVVHFGDAGVDKRLFQPLNSFFSEVSIDVAFLPYWFFKDTDGREIMEVIVNASQNIGIHVPAEARGNGDRWRKQVGGDLFTDPGETRQIP